MDLPDLPISSVLLAIAQRLREGNALVLQAPPGAGKTTYVPLALLNAPWLQGRTIVMLEPRRLAARAAALRMADLLGEDVGKTVGYRMRFDTKVSKQTRIEVVTEGILTRRLQNDQALEGVGLVIFDEFHERHLQADLGLALCLDSMRTVRPDLKILIMSATLNVDAIAKLLDHAPIIESTGRSYPVQVHYLVRDPQEHIAEAVYDCLKSVLLKESGDVLVFLPGAGEIRRTQELLTRELLASEPKCENIKVYPLYGDLSKEAQDRALRPDPLGQRKVILATPIAETSLTIEGIRIVVDSGWARAPKFDPKSGLTRLETVRISKDSAQQRAGRAGRLAPGITYRLWSETTQRGLVAHTQPEMLLADLTPLALDLAQWGITNSDNLSWLTPPPAGPLAQANAVLTDLGALDDKGKITAIGRAMAALPLHPRLAHMLLQAQTLNDGATPSLTPLACDLAALLSERDIFPAAHHARSADAVTRVETLIAFRARGRIAAQSLGADPHACMHTEQTAQQWRRMLTLSAPTNSVTEQDVGILIALAYPDRIAQRRTIEGTVKSIPGRVAESGYFLLANGRGARLRKDDPLAKHDYLATAHIDAGQKEGVIYLAAPITLAHIRAHLPQQIKTQDSVRWDEAEQAVLAQREERLGAIILSAKPLKDSDSAAIRNIVLTVIRNQGIASLPWTEEARALQARVVCLRTWLAEETWPDFTDAKLEATLPDWLAPYLDGVTRRAHFARVDLLAALQNRLDWKQRARLEELAPTHITVPSGSRLPIHYEPDAPPVLAVKLQEMFGLGDTPRVAGGKVLVTLHLLSPARRPIQVTQDLRSFWQRTYPEVKKELKGRYPKHPWPNDPWNATPTAARNKRVKL